jgi:hypothetical protein
VPNTLAQLNSFSNQSYTFEDERPYSISFSSANTANQSVSITESAVFSNPVGIDITNVVSQPGNINYNINLNGIGSNVILTWPTLPATVSSSTPSGNVYRLSGFFDDVVWEQVKNPSIIAVGVNSNFSYSANIQYPNVANVANTDTKSWTTNVSVTSSWAFPSVYSEDTITTPFVINDVDATATSYTVSLQQTSGNTGKWFVGGSEYGPANSVYVSNSSKAAINSANISFFPQIDDTANVNVSINLSKISSVMGNVVIANNVNRTLVVGNTNSEIANMIARSYSSNTSNDIFANSTPSINDGPDLGQIYTITLNSALGKFGNSAANAFASNAYSYTGNMSSVNNEFDNMVFLPSGNATGNFTYTQSRANVNQVNETLTLTGINANVPAGTFQTYTFTSDGSFTPTFEQWYYANARILAAGGGGGGGGGNISVFGGYATVGGGGGGAGSVQIANVTKQTTMTGTYNITVGTGGAYRGGFNGRGGNGTTTIITNGITAYGGFGGFGGNATTTNATNKGGSSGNGFGGGIGANFQLGGGGGGTNGAGGNAINLSSPGGGGAGISSNISGSTVTYATGGSGGQVGTPATAGSTYGSGGSGGGTSSGGGGAGGVVIIKFEP